MTTAHVAPPTALLVAARSAQAEMAVCLRDMGFVPVRVDGADVPVRLSEPVALCVIDLSVSKNGDAIRIARSVRSRHPRAIVIGVADPARPSAAVDALRAGAFDVLPRPLRVRDLEALIANAREQAALATPPLALPESASYGLVGTSPAMSTVMDLVRRAAAGRSGVLISGERGSGREMIARAIHAHGPNHAAPFVKVDCSAPDPEDVEFQIFGAVARPSSAGAIERRGLERVGGHSPLLAAAGGILFLENIAEAPARVQARLVRVLRDREVFSEKSRRAVTLDVRPIAVVDGSLEAALEEGRLRTDLHERLALIRIDVPALRHRQEDIPVLAAHFLKELCASHETPIKTLTRPALTLLAALPWRGNAPELRALLERLVLLVPTGLIRLEDVLTHTQLEGSISPSGPDATLHRARARFERDYISAVLQQHQGRITDAAEVLGMQRTNLYRKMRQLSLLRPRSTGRAL